MDVFYVAFTLISMLVVLLFCFRSGSRFSAFFKISGLSSFYIFFRPFFKFFLVLVFWPFFLVKAFFTIETLTDLVIFDLIRKEFDD